MAEEFATAWQQRHGMRPNRRQLEAIARDAADALAAGDSLEWLTGSVIPFMVGRRYLDLGRARTHHECPTPTRNGHAAAPVRTRFIGSGL